MDVGNLAGTMLAVVLFGGLAGAVLVLVSRLVRAAAARAPELVQWRAAIVEAAATRALARSMLPAQVHPLGDPPAPTRSLDVFAGRIDDRDVWVFTAQFPGRDFRCGAVVRLASPQPTSVATHGQPYATTPTTWSGGTRRAAARMRLSMRPRLGAAPRTLQDVLAVTPSFTGMNVQTTHDFVVVTADQMPFPATPSPTLPFDALDVGLDIAEELDRAGG